MLRSVIFRRLVAVALIGAAAPRCDAHFPWLATDDAGRAILFFGESPTDRDYKVPQCVAEAKVQLIAGAGAPEELPLAAVEEDGFQGRRAADALASGSVLRTHCTYGIYNGMLLNYYAGHVSDLAAFGRTQAAAKAAPLKLDAIPQMDGKDLAVHVSWDGKPLAKAKVTLIPAEGDSQEAESNDEGVAKFEAPGEGLVGCLVEHLDGQAKGTFNDHVYASAADYGTLTFRIGGSAAPLGKSEKPGAPADDNQKGAATAPLPEPLASFGAAASDGWLYVYGGHIGEEHAHSRDNLSTHFRRAPLAGGAWEELPMQTPLQGLPLVAHGGKLYRVGGLSVRNAAGEKDDLHSVAEFSSFDPRTQKWTSLAPLPEARSSHDAAVIGDSLYVVGGWQLTGSNKGKWLSTAWSIDLSNPAAKWTAVPSPPFQRRALAVAAWDGKLVAIGGMDDQQEVSQRVDQFDPGTGKWMRLADLPGDGMQGFGVAAWSVGNLLLVSGTDDAVWQLSTGDDAWRQCGALAHGRFFHRLVPRGDGGLLVVAGASTDEGHLATIEQFALAPPAVASHQP